jgi:hypothetical protein
MLVREEITSNTMDRAQRVYYPTLFILPLCFHYKTSMVSKSETTKRLNRTRGKTQPRRRPALMAMSSSSSRSIHNYFAPLSSALNDMLVPSQLPSSPIPTSPRYRIAKALPSSSASPSPRTSPGPVLCKIDSIDSILDTLGRITSKTEEMPDPTTTDQISDVGLSSKICPYSVRQRLLRRS